MKEEREIEGSTNKIPTPSLTIEDAETWTNTA